MLSNEFIFRGWHDQTVHKSMFGLCFWAVDGVDPLIDRFK